MYHSVFTRFFACLFTLFLLSAHSYGQEIPDTTDAHRYWQEATVFQDSSQLDSAHIYYAKAAEAFWGAAKLQADTMIVRRAYVSAMRAESILHRKRKYIEANLLLKKNIQLMQDLLPGDTKKIVSLWGRTGRNYNYMMKFADAESAYTRALDMHLAQAEATSYRQAQLLIDRGVVKREQGKWEEALNDLSSAKDLSTEGKNASFKPIILFHIGMTYLRKKSYDEAVPYFLSSAELFEQADPPSPEVGKAYGNLNFCLRRQGRYQEALVYADKCIQALERGFGKESALYARALMGKVSVYIPTGNYIDAEKYTREALNIT
ncbi:MAG: tetratricopeptide repeat protein, partial [Bacteroidota bacterium]